MSNEEFARNMWISWSPRNLPTRPRGDYLIDYIRRNGTVGRGAQAGSLSWEECGARTVAQYRWVDKRVVLLNPYTGAMRDVNDIISDPEGKLIVNDGEPVKSYEPDLLNGTMGDMLLGIGASEDHELVRSALAKAGFNSDIIDRVMTAVCNYKKPPRIDDFQIVRGRCTIIGPREDVEQLNRIIGEPDESDSLGDVLYREEAAEKTLEAMGYTYTPGAYLWKPPLGKTPAFSAPDLLDAAAGHMRDRAKTYDKPGGERSMGKTVDAFNTITGRTELISTVFSVITKLNTLRIKIEMLDGGKLSAFDAKVAVEMLEGCLKILRDLPPHDLRESEGWLLMSLLKMVRSETRVEPHRDSLEDNIAYGGLYAEARLAGR